jgi:serine/threonine protein kinase/formylglycine-generating enzyme required for sulfatase activity
MTDRKPDPHDLEATRPTTPPRDLDATQPAARPDDTAATRPAPPRAAASPAPALAFDPEATRPAPSRNATTQVVDPDATHMGPGRSSTTVSNDPVTAGPRDQHDLQATVPAAGWDGARTLPLSAPAPGSQPSSDQTLPANMNVAHGDAPTLRPGDRQAMTVVNQGATRQGFTQSQGGGTQSGTQSATQGGTLGGTLNRSATGFGRTLRTKMNTKLEGGDQQLDSKLQLSRPSVLAEMANSRLARGESAGGIPIGIRKKIEEQGTDGRYAIEKKLAQGGMGAVLKIDDHDFDRKAAMKIMLSKLADNAEATERFLDEARVTAQLEHPNIVPIHDMGVMEDGTLYFTMKMIQGTSLGDVVKQLRLVAGLDGPNPKKSAEWNAEFRAAAEKAAPIWTEDEKLHAFLKVLDGVGFAHGKGVVHRDIKPDNIMIGGHGEVLVVDWGIAKVLAHSAVPGSAALAAAGNAAAKGEVASLRTAESLSATMEGSAMGTIFYMPPEQATGELAKIDARSDVYALGATLYELLSLKRCIEGNSLPDLILKITGGELIPLKSVMPDISPDLAAIVHKAMARQQEFRYPTCEAFAEDLRKYMAGAAVEARKRGVGELLQKWIAANRGKIIATAAGIAVVAVAVTLTVKSIEKAAHDKAVALTLAVNDDLTKAGDSAPSDTYAQLRNKLAPADDILAADKDYQALAGVLLLDLGKAKDREAAAAKAKADADQAQEFFRKAQDEFKNANFADADRDISAAQHLAPGDTDILKARDQIKQAVADAVLADKKTKAQSNLTAAIAALNAAQPLDPADPKATDLLKQADDQIALASSDPQATPPGLADQVVAAETLRAKIKKAGIAAKNLEQAKTLVAKAKAALAANDLATAGPAAEQAMGFAPDDAEVKAVYVDTATRQAMAAQIAAALAKRKNAEDAASGFIAQAHKAKDTLDANRAAESAATADVAKLDAALAGHPLKDKAPLFARLQDVKNAHRDWLQSWSACESAAQSAVAALDPYAADKPPTWTDGRKILADLYFGRYIDAKNANDQAGATAFAGLLRQYNDGTYDAVLNDRATLVLAGKPTATVSARRLVEDQATTLFVCTGDPVIIPPGGSIQLANGTWQLTDGTTIMAVPLHPDHPTTVTWPGALPTIAGQLLYYVPGDADKGIKPFMLSAHECTFDDYIAFLKDPAQYPGIKAEVHKYLKDVEAAVNGVAPDQPRYDHVPMSMDMNPETCMKVRLDIKNDDLQNISALESGALPVTFIDRDDAIAYCAWLSAKSGLKVRLPTPEEFAFACNGGDPQRVYPWGHHFDPNFTWCSAHGRQNATKVMSVPTDVGPFGHFDLAGNVREWLAGMRSFGDNDALLAAGSFTDDDEHWFRCNYFEANDSKYRIQQIGFRILVEMPAEKP